MEQPRHVSVSVFVRLAIMMFLQFFIWGAWYVTVGQYMSTEGIRLELSIGWIYTVGPIAAIISPVFLGMIADRYFSTERVLGVLHIVGGAVLLFSPLAAEMAAGMWADTLAQWESEGLSAQQVAERAQDYWIVPAHLPFIGLIFLHMLCYMPTLGLTNTLSFHNLTNPEKQFPLIRVFGTIGWIVAGVVVSIWLGADEKALPLQIAGGCAIALGLFSFFLPHTPPPARGQRARVSEVLGLESVRLMREVPFAVFIMASLLICIPLAAYYAFAQLFVNHAGFEAPAGVMTIGQMSEVIFMLLMPLCFVRLGVKWMLLVGMLAWVLRYGLFAAGAPEGMVWMILLGIVMHGICYDFFFVTGFIYTDRKAPRSIRGQAQGFLVLVTQGIGLGLGAQIMQRVVNAEKAADYDALVATAGTLREEADALEKAGSTADAAVAWERASELLLRSYDWQGIWLFACIFAAVVAVLFLLFFHDRLSREERGKVTDAEVAEAAAAEEQA